MKNTKKLGFMRAGVLLLLASFGFTQSAHALITQTLDLGQRNGEVTELQQFLGTNSYIYPANLVTGYFGGMTQTAVMQFQEAYGISQVGRVGPQTEAKINAIMNSGLGLDISAPMLSNVNIQTYRNSTTVNWTSNEAATGKVFYDTQPIQMTEQLGVVGVPYISGNVATNNMNAAYSESVSIQNLQPNTLYYYVVQSTDNSGNVTITWPTTFYTTN